MESWGEKKYRNLFEEAGHTQKEIPVSDSDGGGQFFILL